MGGRCRAGASPLLKQPGAGELPEVEIYTTPFCPYCLRAKLLLKSKGIAFTEIDTIAEPDRRWEMAERSSGRDTVPQVFVDGDHIGDCDDLFALDARGELDPLLGISV